MPPTLLRIASAIGALLELLAVYVGILLTVWGLFACPWREWIDFATAGSTLPFAVLSAFLILLICGTRRRYRLSCPGETRNQRASLVGWLFAALSCVAIPITLLIGTSRFADLDALSLVTPLALAASLLPIIGGALFEEFVYRQVALGCYTRIGMPLALAVAIQSFLFAAMHGRGALTDPDRLSWLLIGGLLLGTIYVATRSIWPGVLCHVLMNVCLAQTRPTWNWYTHRVIDEVSPEWTRPLTLLWVVLLAAYWTWRIRHDLGVLIPRRLLTWPALRMAP